MHRAGVLAEHYASSALARENAGTTRALLAKNSSSAELDKELSVDAESIPPFWWGLRTMLKVRAVLRAHCCGGQQPTLACALHVWLPSNPIPMAGGLPHGGGGVCGQL